MNKEPQSVGIRDAYAMYKRESKKPVPKNVYLDIMNGYSKFLFDLLLSGEQIKIPERLGTMYFGGTKQKPWINKETDEVEGLPPDWKTTREMWKKNPEMKARKEMVYYFNEHTNGIRYKLQWSKRDINITNKDFYSFKLSRANKKAFSRGILEGKDYPMILKKDRRHE